MAKNPSPKFNLEQLAFASSPPVTSSGLPGDKGPAEGLQSWDPYEGAWPTKAQINLTWGKLTCDCWPGKFSEKITACGWCIFLYATYKWYQLPQICLYKVYRSKFHSSFPLYSLPFAWKKNAADHVKLDLFVRPWIVRFSVKICTDVTSSNSWSKHCSLTLVALAQLAESYDFFAYSWTSNALPDLILAWSSWTIVWHCVMYHCLWNLFLPCQNIPVEWVATVQRLVLQPMANAGQVSMWTPGRHMMWFLLVQKIKLLTLLHTIVVFSVFF